MVAGQRYATGAGSAVQNDKEQSVGISASFHPLYQK